MVFVDGSFDMLAAHEGGHDLISKDPERFGGDPVAEFGGHYDGPNKSHNLMAEGTDANRSGSVLSAKRIWNINTVGIKMEQINRMRDSRFVRVMP
jgi:hypothetical protein